MRANSPTGLSVCLSVCLSVACLPSIPFCHYTLERDRKRDSPGAALSVAPHLSVRPSVRPSIRPVPPTFSK